MAFNIDILEKDLNSKMKGANLKLAEKFIENDRVEVLDSNYNEELKLIRIEWRVL